MEKESMPGNSKKTDDNTALFETARYFVAYQGFSDGKKSASGEDSAERREMGVAWK